MDSRNHVKLNKYQLKDAVAEMIAGAPGTPAEGQFWYDTVAKKLNYRNDAANVPLGASVQKFAASVGDNSEPDFDVAHNLNTEDVVVRVYQISDGVEVFPDVTIVDADTVNVAFAATPTANQYRVIVVG